MLERESGLNLCPTERVLERRSAWRAVELDAERFERMTSRSRDMRGTRPLLAKSQAVPPITQPSGSAMNAG